MNNFSSSSPTPPPFRPTSAAATPTRLTPAVIPLDYNYRIMSPSCYTHTLSTPRMLHHANDIDDADALNNQYNSLFGDPVPPPPPAEFLGSELDNTQFFRATQMNASSEEDVYDESMQARCSRLFPTQPFASNLSRRLSSSCTERSYVDLEMPRLQPPDIKILANSSAGSSTDVLGSPNFTLLRPDDILTKPALYENLNAADVNEIMETVTISDADGTREYTEAKRRVSNFTDDFRSNVGMICQTPTNESTMMYKRSDSNASHSSEDWFRPATRDFPEFSKIPKLRPSSKNVMSIKRMEMPTQLSPVAAMFNDSSSSDERLLEDIETREDIAKVTDEAVPERPPSPSENILLSLHQNTTSRRMSLSQNIETNFNEIPPPADPPPIPPAPILEGSATPESVKRSISPGIQTNLIATGGDYRVNTPRLHKKISFTILSNKSAQSSLAPTPSEYSQSRSSIAVPTPTSAKPVAKPRYSLPKKSLSSTQLKLPKIQAINQFTSDDSPRPSVQFDMTGNFSPIKMPAKGILQHRESFSSSQDALAQASTRFPSALPPLFPHGQKHQSYETLPMLKDPYRTAIPRLNRSAFDLGKEKAVFPPGALPRPLKPNPNPTRKQRGLLRVLNKNEVLSQIPLRSNWSSMDDLSMNLLRRKQTYLQKRRRSSSTSPERRSSTQTASDRRSSNLSSITTSDFSFRRPSNTSMEQRRKSSLTKSPVTPQRRKSIIANRDMSMLPRTKISKPTTLSPIIGTPNKDSSSPQSPVNMAMPTGPSSETPSDTSRRDSISKIPLRRGSQSSSRIQSRSSSPIKELTAQLPISGRSSRATPSHSPSSFRRNESPRDSSRSVSRASTRPISQVPSRASSRPNSRLEQTKQTTDSRSNSRASITKTSRSNHNSISPQRKFSTPVAARRKAISLSPKVPHKANARRSSISPTKSKTSNQKIKSATPRNSRSFIPRRASVSSRNSKSPTKSKSALLTNKKSTTIRSKPTGKSKEAASVKKSASSVKKPESSVKRTPSSVTKQKAATKKEPNIVQKTASNIKREASNVQKKSTIKREISPISTKKTTAAGKIKSTAVKSGNKANISKQAENKSVLKQAEKNIEKDKPKETVSTATGENLRAAVTEAAKDGAVAAMAGAAVAAAVASGVNENVKSEMIDTSTTSPGMKRTSSKMSLIRMGSRMSLFNKKRPDSSLGRQITEEELIDTNQNSAEVGSANALSKPLTAEAVAILEKSQKTLENVQKTVSVATDEIQKTIDRNLIDLKTLESEAVKSTIDSGASPASSAATVVENKSAMQTLPRSTESMPKQKSPLPSGQPIEADVSVINADATKIDNSERVSERAISALAEVESESANLQNYEQGTSSDPSAVLPAASKENHDAMEPHSDDFKVDAKRRSPDGQGGSTAGSAEKTGSEEEFLKQQEAEEQKGCCRICNKLCMPCRRSRCSQCCRRKKSMRLDDSEEPVLSATSSATTTHLELVDEKNIKPSCWQRLNCCQRCRKKPSSASSTRTLEIKEEIMHSQTPIPSNQSKCGLCLSKVFCCRSVNKVDPTTGDETQLKKCCFCIPCRRKKPDRASNLGSANSSMAWQDPERAISPNADSVLEGMSTESKPGCCKRFWSKCLCCRKKKPAVGSESRRASIKPAPPEDTRRKLHVDLVEYNSKMKGAIPVLPLYLAWFCAICNTLFPGLGTLLSGFFCVCVGIPRFSHYDSAKARFGSFLINIIVACSQLFCVLFCLVGWGWSIWWGAIMIKCAKKLNKIKKVERLEMEEEQRQQQAEAEAAREAANRNLNMTESTETTKT